MPIGYIKKERVFEFLADKLDRIDHRYIEALVTSTALIVQFKDCKGVEEQIIKRQVELVADLVNQDFPTFIKDVGKVIEHLGELTRLLGH